jgi:hypothetical protein
LTGKFYRTEMGSLVTRILFRTVFRKSGVTSRGFWLALLRRVPDQHRYHPEHDGDQEIAENEGPAGRDALGPAGGQPRGEGQVYCRIVTSDTTEMLAVYEAAAGTEASVVGLGSRRLRRQTGSPGSQRSSPSKASCRSRRRRSWDLSGYFLSAALHDPCRGPNRTRFFSSVSCAASRQLYGQQRHASGVSPRSGRADRGVSGRRPRSMRRR